MKGGSYGMSRPRTASLVAIMVVYALFTTQVVAFEGQGRVVSVLCVLEGGIAEVLSQGLSPRSHQHLLLFSVPLQCTKRLYHPALPFICIQLSHMASAVSMVATRQAVFGLLMP